MIHLNILPNIHFLPARAALLSFHTNPYLIYSFYVFRRLPILPTMTRYTYCTGIWTPVTIYNNEITQLTLLNGQRRSFSILWPERLITLPSPGTLMKYARAVLLD